MLSSRPQHVLYADKENSTSLAPSRATGAGLTGMEKANLLKTPGAKQRQLCGSKTVKAGSSKLALESTQLKNRKLGGGPATIALEPGARVLGAKDANNRAFHGKRGPVQNGKGKEKAIDSAYDDCSLVPVSKQSSINAGIKSAEVINPSVKSKPSSTLATAKTPARQTARTPLRPPEDVGHIAYKTPRFQTPNTLKRASPSHNSLIPSFSAFKTPSPNQLLRRRRGGGSPVPWHFNPTSLRLDGIEEQADIKPPKPTLLEELDAYHATIDDTQEVDCATRQAVDPDTLPVDLPFEMPNYKEMDILGIAFRATFLMSQLAATPMDESVPISYDDADMHLRDEVYEKEWEHEPLFPLEVTPKARAVKGRRLSASQSKADHVSTQPSKVAKGHPEAARGLSSKSLATTNPRVTNTTGPGRQASGISVPRSKTNSQTLKASNLSKEAKPPRTVYRPKLSDFPDVIPFELGEIDLLN